MFDGKRGTLIGGGATLHIGAAVTIGNKSNLSIRDLDITDDPQLAGDVPAITCEDSVLVVDRLRSSAHKVVTIASSGSQCVATLRQSSFTVGISGGSVVVLGRLIVDRCTFSEGGLVAGSIDVENSIVVTPASRTALKIFADAALPPSSVLANTFVGGDIDCAGGSDLSGNIFFQHGTIQAPVGCSYNDNLAVPALPSIGVRNITGDPSFVNISAGDLHLKSGSPAIDANLDPSLGGGHDFDGVARPKGSHWDIGAFEFVP